ncbi:MAG: hypothetical protein M3463_13090 [Verrucomicrobiota bacterium]|nr:hypothetical protein [Verrucomicrobiota bacterium]
MHDAFYRQLTLCAVFAALAGNVSPPPRSAAEEASATVELQALAGEHSTLAAQPEHDERAWQNLEERYAALARKFPREVEVRARHGEFLWERGKQDLALREWEAARALQPRNAAVLNHLGGSQLAQGDPQAAYRYFLEATQAEPGRALYHYNLANVVCLFRHELGTPEDQALDFALAHFAEASRLAPLSPEYARAYAETFYMVSKPDWTKALGGWQKFMELTSQKEFALLNLARVHMKLGQGAQARACLAQIQNPAFDRLKTRLLERISAELGREAAPAIPPRTKSQKPSIDEAASAP